MRKTTFALLIVFGFVFAAAAFSIPKPSARIKNFDVAAIGLRDITFLFDIAVKNPYPVGLKLESVKMQFNVEGKQFFKTETSQGFKIKARGEASNIVTINLKYVDIIKIIKDYSKKDYLNTTIDTEIIVPLPKIAATKLLPKTLSFKYKLSKRIPALKPTVSVLNFSVVPPSLDDVARALKKSGKSADPKKTLGMVRNILDGKDHEKVIDPSTIDLPIKTKFDIELKNDSRAKLDFSNLNYDFYVDNAPFVKGTTSQIKRSGDRQILTIENSFSSRSLAGPVLAAFKKRKGVFIVKGNTMVKLPLDIKKDPVKLSFDEGGNFDMKK
jgi:LEA14-like dessication related protein